VSVPEYECLLYALTDGVATITLNRPDRMNVYNSRMRTELISVFDRTDADDAVKAVVFTGSGRAFCAGADISEGKDALDANRRRDPGQPLIVNGVRRDGTGMLTLRIFNSLKPVIAAINGAAAGAGATLTLPMDIRMASTEARYGFVFARRGVTPEAASSWFLPRLVGIATSLEWCYSGRLVTAQEALAAGLVRSIHAPSELLPAAQALAREFAANGAPVSMALTRQMMWRMLGASHPMEAHSVDSRAIRARGASADAKEGLTAFLQKRQPIFVDRVTDLPNVFPNWIEPEFR
jgi:enoyl-CoA hydratase/carnithine racemase